MKLKLPEPQIDTRSFKDKDLYVLMFVDQDQAWKLELNHSDEARYKQPKVWHNITECEKYAIGSGYSEFNILKVVI